MRQSSTAAIVAATATLIAGAALFTYRGEIRDAVGAYQRGAVPAETPRAQVSPVAIPVAPVVAEPTNTKPVTPKPPTKETPEPVVTAPPVKEPVPSLLPKEFNLKVPMVFQAPFKVWDDVHEDACEEASALMLRAYLTDAGPYTPDQMETMIEAAVTYEMETFGDYHNTTAAQTAQMLRDHLSVRGARVITIDTADDIRAQIAKGNPVLIPAAGKLLGNPNFRNGGPNYHMLVIKGYTADGRFITNDPGTRLGENYAYPAETLLNAIHDYNGDDMIHGAKVGIIAD